MAHKLKLAATCQPDRFVPKRDASTSHPADKGIVFNLLGENSRSGVARTAIPELKPAAQPPPRSVPVQSLYAVDSPFLSPRRPG